MALDLVMIAWACVLCTPVGSSAEEALAETTPTAAPSASPPASTMSASEHAERLATLTAEGQRCKDKGDHDCVVDRYSSAYHLLDHEDRTGRLGLRYVDLMIDSCDVLAKQADAAQYRGRFEVFESIIDLQISEIDRRHVIEPTKKRGKKARKHRQREEGIKEQRARLEESKQRLEELLNRLAIEGSNVTRLLPTIVVQPEPEGPRGKEPTPTTDEDPGPDPILPEQPKQEEIEDESRRVNTRRLILGTIGTAGGSLTTLTGVALMLNGVAWNSCYNHPNNTCHGLIGAIKAFGPGIEDVPEDETISEGRAREKSVRNWVSGSLITAVGVAAVTLGAIELKRAREGYREREYERQRQRDRARARRESIALAPSWSPLSPRQGGLSIIGRF